MTRRMRPPVAVALLLALVAGLVACGGGAATPDQVVAKAVTALVAKDVAGLRALSCAGQEEMLRSQLGIGGTAGDDLLPGLDINAVLDAVTIASADVQYGEPAIDGEVAEVNVTGTVEITFDREAVRPILEAVLRERGSTPTTEQLDAMLTALEAYGHGLPVDQAIRLVRENGAWLICADTVPQPAG